MPAQADLPRDRRHRRHPANSFSIALVPERHAPRAARAAVAGLRFVPAAQVETLKLLVTELVTNSVRHAGLRCGQPIVVEVIRSGGVLRITVTDQGPGFTPDTHAPSMSASGGRGLFLVRSLSSRWGIERVAGARVWCELDVGEAAPRGLVEGRDMAATDSRPHP